MRTSSGPDRSRRQVSASILPRVSSPAGFLRGRLEPEYGTPDVPRCYSVLLASERWRIHVSCDTDDLVRVRAIRERFERRAVRMTRSAAIRWAVHRAYAKFEGAGGEARAAGPPALWVRCTGRRGAGRGNACRSAGGSPGPTPPRRAAACPRRRSTWPRRRRWRARRDVPGDGWSGGTAGRARGDSERIGTGRGL